MFCKLLSSLIFSFSWAALTFCNWFNVERWRSNCWRCSSCWSFCNWVFWSIGVSTSTDFELPSTRTKGYKAPLRSLRLDLCCRFRYIYLKSNRALSTSIHYLLTYYESWTPPTCRWARRYTFTQRFADHWRQSSCSLQSWRCLLSLGLIEVESGWCKGSGKK